MVRLRSTDPNLQSGPVTLNNTIYFLLDGEIEVSEAVASIFWGHPTWRRVDPPMPTVADVQGRVEQIHAAATQPVAVIATAPILAEIKPPAPVVRGIRRKSS